MILSRRLFEVPLLALFFFVDPLVFFRVLVSDDRVSICLYGGLVVALFTFSRHIWLTGGVYRSRITWLLFLYGVASIAARVWAGQVLTYLVQHIIVVMQIGVLWVFIRRPYYRQRLIEAYAIAAYLHLLASLPGIPWLSEQLSQNTAYWDGEYAIGFITRRATGFFNSPGQLSLFAVGGLALGVGGFHYRMIGARQSLVAISLILGVAALSRSFFITCVGVLLLYALIGNFKAKLQVSVLIATAVFVISRNATFSDYFALIVERLRLAFTVAGNDRLSGETGIIEAAKVIAHYPWFGYLVASEGKALFAWNGEMLVRPHVALLQVLAYYGVIVGLPLLLLLNRAWWAAGRYMLRSHVGLIQNPWVLGLMAVNILCLVEPLLETPIYFLFLFGVLVMQVNQRIPAGVLHGTTDVRSSVASSSALS
jgi:hypothetical protein